MKTFLTIVALSALAIISAPQPTVSAGSCGIKPIKPIPPAGCKDLRAECVCDNQGKNCKWQWICVPR